ncbi:MAG: hypothetical protein H5T71_07245 [Chloroflexi bacterium]|nr:hypothetical protein [Chloroflexota bacterium]
MADLAYHELYRIDPVAARRLLGKTYQETGSVRATAQSWHTSRQVVCFWVRRYAAEGGGGVARPPLGICSVSCASLTVLRHLG